MKTFRLERNTCLFDTIKVAIKVVFESIFFKIVFHLFTQYALQLTLTPINFNTSYFRYICDAIIMTEKN